MNHLSRADRPGPSHRWYSAIALCAAAGLAIAGVTTPAANAQTSTTAANVVEIPNPTFPVDDPYPVTAPHGTSGMAMAQWSPRSAWVTDDGITWRESTPYPIATQVTTGANGHAYLSGETNESPRAIGLTSLANGSATRIPLPDYDREPGWAPQRDGVVIYDGTGSLVLVDPDVSRLTIPVELEGDPYHITALGDCYFEVSYDVVEPVDTTMIKVFDTCSWKQVFHESRWSGLDLRQVVGDDLFYVNFMGIRQYEVCTWKLSTGEQECLPDWFSDPSVAYAPGAAMTLQLNTVDSTYTYSLKRMSDGEELWKMTVGMAGDRGVFQPDGWCSQFGTEILCGDGAKTYRISTSTGDPGPDPDPGPGPDPDIPVDRLHGETRYDTAAAISNFLGREGVPVAYVATGENYPDALSGGAAAGLFGYPLLLVEPDSIPAAIGDELSRLQPARILVLGGPVAISDEVLEQLKDYAGQVDRVHGPDRYSTANEVAGAVFDGGAHNVLIASGANFPDALSSASLVAGDWGGPILLSHPRSGLSQATLSTIQDLHATTAFLLGGTVAVPQIVETQLAELGLQVERIGGADRFATSLLMAQHSFPAESDVVYFTTGVNFPDGLALTPLAATFPGPLLLVDGDCLKQDVADYVKQLSPAKLVLVGGEEAVPDDVGLLKPCA